MKSINIRGWCLSIYTIKIIAFNINLLAFIIQMIQICPNWKFYSMHTTLAEGFARISILSWKNLPTRQNSSFACNFPQFWIEDSSFTCNFPQFCQMGLRCLPPLEFGMRFSLIFTPGPWMLNQSIILRHPFQQTNLCWDDSTLGRVY